MILASLAIVAPIFALVALGYGVVRARLASAEAGNGLSEFVFVLAIPALLFRTVAGADFPSLNPLPYWAAYFIPLALCWTLAGLYARRLGRDATEQAITGFAAAQSNTVMVGIPVILGTLGDRGSVAIVLLLVVHLPVTMSIVTLLIARGEGGGAGRLLRSLALHPILLAIFAGLAWRAAGLPMPDILRTLLRYLGDTAAPCALVAMGMSMHRVALAGNRRIIALVTAIKLVLHPLLVYLLGVKLMGLSPLFAASALLFAACPTGINAFLVADRYKSGAATVSGAITLSTVLAIVTMTFAVSVATGLMR